MEAQVSYEFVGGSILFFTALALVISALFGSFPAYSRSSEVNNLYQEAWAISDHLINRPGYHVDGTNGTDWENNIDETTSIGFASSPKMLDREKINTLTDLDYSNVTQIFGTENDLRINVNEYVVVDTYYNFSKLNPPSSIDPPTTSTVFNNANNSINYGDKNINGTNMWFLVANTASDSYYVWASESDRDFNETGTNSFNLSKSEDFKINKRNYTFNHQTRETTNSEGSVLILERDIVDFRKYNSTGESTAVVSQYASLDGNIAEIKVKLW